MIEASQVITGMPVIDTQGQRLGTVSGIHDAIVEVARDGAADRLHPFVPLAGVRDIRDGQLVIERCELTTVEAVITALEYSRARARRSGSSLFGTSGHGTGMGGASVGS
jgi:hypothetical protein